MKKHIRKQYSTKYAYRPIHNKLSDMVTYMHKVAAHWSHCGGYNEHSFFEYYYGDDDILLEFLLTFREPMLIEFIEIR